MLNRLKKNREGFTIIEVMIVLAIAGLIILIVLLAVPALQRNSRNTAIKNDASGVAGAITTSESDNDGTPPTSVKTTAPGVVTVANTTTETAKVQAGTTVNDGAAASTPVAATAAQTPTGTIQVLRGQTCALAASARAVAVYYSIETTSGNQIKCVDA